MKRFWLAAFAAGMLTAAPASALDIRVDPAPLYVFDQANERNVYDVVLQNILVVNDERRAREIRGLRIELRANGEIISTGRSPAATIARRAERMSQLSEGGVLQMMDFQFHLSRIMHEGERLSADATLDPGEAYLNSSFYISADALPDSARVIVEGPRGDLGYVDIPVSRYTSPITYRAPVNGRWFVVASGDVSQHHRWVVSSEYALDITRMNADMRTYTGDGTHFSDYITFRQPIVAVADGVVVATRNDREENEATLRQPGEAFDAYMQRVVETQQATIMQGGFDAVAGNYVLIRHANGEHSLYAHLHQGSVRVNVGDTVTAGAQIAEAGSSGNSTEPHLHFQLIDGPDLNAARGLPITFTGLRPEWVSIEGRHLRSGDVLEQE
ncbi:MAG: M23 family metallopeptidase [Caulobacteraceae bacterium]|nr:M23 family metallopeptidase [Caulobacteraceae bacterium]